jgi:hypothetical protein
VQSQEQWKLGCVMVVRGRDVQKRWCRCGGIGGVLLMLRCLAVRRGGNVGILEEKKWI